MSIIILSKKVDRIDTFYRYEILVFVQGQKLKKKKYILFSKLMFCHGFLTILFSACNTKVLFLPNGILSRNKYFINPFPLKLAFK